MNLIKVFIRTIKNSILDFWTNKRFFLISGLFLISIFMILIGGIFYSFFYYLIVYIPGGYVFAPKMMGIIIMFLFFFIIFLTFIATIPTMFKNKEIKLIFTLPITYDKIFTYGIVKLSYFALYGSIFVLLPIFIAYGLANNLGFYYFLLIPIIILLLTILSTLIGSFIFWIINLTFFPLPKIIQIPILLILASIFIYQGIKFIPKLDIPDKKQGFSIIETYVFTFNYQNLLFPYNRFTKTIYYIGENNILKALTLIIFIITTTFLIYTIFKYIANNLYLKALENFEKFNLRNKKRKLAFKTFFTKDKYKNLFIKDMIIHIKDPTQWSQMIVFIILLFIYIAIIKGTTIGKILDPKIVSILTLGGLALVGFFVGGIALRFVFPNISLEGKSFWVLKLAPISLRKLYLIKLIFFNIFILTISFILIYSYVNILGFLTEIKYLIYILTFFISIFLTSLFFSLGSAFPDFKETNPSKIATSYGGLLSIFLSNAIILSIIAILRNPLINYYQNKFLCVNKGYSILVLFVIISCLTLLAINIGLVIFGYKKFKNLEI